MSRGTVSTDALPDTDAAVEFLQWARPSGPWTLTAIVPDGPTTTGTFTSTDPAAAWIDRYQGKRNLYWMVNPAKRLLSKKASKDDVEALEFLHVDLDPEKGKEFEAERARIRERLDTFEPKPSAVVDSGGGYQAFWRLVEPLPIDGNPAEAEAYSKQLGNVLGGDATHNCDRIMRLPGTINLPNQKKRQAGRMPSLASVTSLGPATYSLSDFTPMPGSVSGVGVELAIDLPPVSIDRLSVTDRMREVIRDGNDTAKPYRSRSEALYAVTCSLVRAGCDNDAIAAVILDPSNGVSSSVLDKPNPRKYAAKQIEKARGAVRAGVQSTDFYAYMPTHSYIFAPTGENWPAASVNSRVPRIPLLDAAGKPILDKAGKPIHQLAATWLDQNRHVEQMTWAPGLPEVVVDRLVAEGGWIEHPGCSVFNLYRPPPPFLDGDASQAGMWIELVRRIYPDDAEHIFQWLAHRVQRPEEKINHALSMGGAQGIGKDSILEPVKAAVGQWNFTEVSPKQVFGRFNGFVKSVILRVSEARDLGDVDRYGFYEHMKTYTAAPPDVLRVDEKFRTEYSVFNVCGVIITSNHKTNGIFLPADDRRHYVAWSDLAKEDFEPDFWTSLWRWYSNGGIGHVVAFLRALDLSKFDAKAPPPKTAAFLDIVTANFAPEDAEISTVLEQLGRPEAVTVDQMVAKAAVLEKHGKVDHEFIRWMKDRRNSRQIPHRLSEGGYAVCRNRYAKSGRFTVNGRDCNIYARKELEPRGAIAAAERLASRGWNELTGVEKPQGRRT